MEVRGIEPLRRGAAARAVWERPRTRGARVPGEPAGGRPAGLPAWRPDLRVPPAVWTCGRGTRRGRPCGAAAQRLADQATGAGRGRIRGTPPGDDAGALMSRLRSDALRSPGWGARACLAAPSRIGRSVRRSRKPRPLDAEGCPAVPPGARRRPALGFLRAARRIDAASKAVAVSRPDGDTGLRPVDPGMQGGALREAAGFTTRADSAVPTPPGSCPPGPSAGAGSGDSFGGGYAAPAGTQAGAGPRLHASVA
jgi:hypothetical protein